MARTGENIYKRKDGRWEGRYVKAYDAAGKRIIGYVYAKTYHEVKIKLTYAIATGQKQPPPVSGVYAFGDLATEWLYKVKADCKESTYNKYKNTYDRNLSATLGKYPIAKISAQMIDTLLLRLLTSGKKDGTGYSHKSVQETCTVIKQIANYAENTYQIKVQFPANRLHIKQEQMLSKTLTKDEIQTLRDYLTVDPDNYKVGVLICLFTGIRIGELCALQWKDISISEGTIYVHKTAQRVQQLGNALQKTKVIITSPKSECSNRIIPMPQFLVQTLRSRQLSDEYFLLSGRSECAEPKVMENRFKKYLRACRLPNVTFHTLRHTFATRCIELGVDAKTLSEILGHSSVNITLNRYVHSSMEQKKRAVSLLEAE